MFSISASCAERAGARAVARLMKMMFFVSVGLLVLTGQYKPVQAGPIKLMDIFKQYKGKSCCIACYNGDCGGNIFGFKTVIPDPTPLTGVVTCQQGSCKGRCIPYKQVNVQIIRLTGGSAVTGTMVNCKCNKEGPPPCFPASATVRRLTADNTLETVAMPQLRIGDTVECLVRDPVVDEFGRVTSSDVTSSRLSRCQVYDYKKAMTDITSQYVTITYKRPGSASEPGSVTMTANHHILNARTGQAVKAGNLKPGDEVLMVTDKMSARAKVVRITPVEATGAYVPLLTDGGLLVVDGVVAYPSSGDSATGLDSKHWGQYFLSAPVWQSLGENNDVAGKTLFELGSEQEHGPIGAFTKKFYAVGKAAADEGRTFSDWAGVAAEMRRAIVEFGKVYTEEEALEVYDRHIYRPAS